MTTGLSSDHLNYLVWRYLQECGYGNAAIQLQRDWENTNPQQLPFAASVKPLTLRSIVQDGLVYDSLLAESRKQNRFTENGASPTEDYKDINGLNSHTGKRYLFVDIRKRATSERVEEASRPSSSSQDGSRKKPRISTAVPRTVSQPSSSGRRKPTSAKDFGADVMEVDVPSPKLPGDEDMRDPTPVEEPPPPPPPPTTLEVGTSVGLQSEAVVDRTIAKLVSDAWVSGTDLVHLHWHNTDPTKLEACGEGAWRTYNFPDGHTIFPSSDIKTLSKPEHKSWIPDNAKNFYVTAQSHMSGPSNTSASAIEMEEDELADLSIRVYTSPDEAAINFKSQGLTPLLQFSPNNKLLLGIAATSPGEWRMTVWNITRPNDEPLHLDVSNIEIAALAWLGNTEFAICGKNMIDFYRIRSNSADPELSSSTNGGSTDPLHPKPPTELSAPRIEFYTSQRATRDWEQLAYDSATHKLACLSPEDGYLGLLTVPEFSSAGTPAEPIDFQFFAKQIHDAEITGIMWQPLGSSLVPAGPRLLATCANDGEVKLWDAAPSTPACIRTFRMDPLVPAMAVAFSPAVLAADSLIAAAGSRLAAAGGRQIKVWRADAAGELLAHWEGSEPDAGAAAVDVVAGETAHANGDSSPGMQDQEPRVQQQHPPSSDAPFHRLAWNCTGRRVAYSQGERLSVIEVPEITAAS